MVEEREEEEGRQQPIPTTDRDRRIVARFLDLLAAGFVALAVATGFDGEYGRAVAALIGGLIVFLCGIYWDQIRALIGPALSRSMVAVASDARSWLAVLFIVFGYIAAPNFIARLNQPAPPNKSEPKSTAAPLKPSIPANFYEFKELSNADLKKRAFAIANKLYGANEQFQRRQKEARQQLCPDTTNAQFPSVRIPSLCPIYQVPVDEEWKKSMVPLQEEASAAWEEVCHRLNQYPELFPIPKFYDITQNISGHSTGTLPNLGEYAQYLEGLAKKIP
jgi:hypothetical protein